MKHLYLIMYISATLLYLCCSTPDNSGIINPVNSLPDTLPDVKLQSFENLPVIIAGKDTDPGCTSEELEKAIDSLSDMDKKGVIRFSTGGSPDTIRLSRPLIISSDSLVVIDGENLITLDGQNSTRIIECDHYADLVLANTNLINGLSDSSGGALMHPWYGKLSYYNVNFNNNRCSATGPEFGGGAVFAGGLEKAFFYNCSFSDNLASNGGAILNRGTNLYIDSCSFVNNTASGNGGGKDAGAKGNGGLGGGVYIDGMNYDYAEPFYLRKTTFEQNLSNCHGSAVFSYYYKDKPGQSGALIEKCGFYSNRDSGTVTSSGALYHEGSPLKLYASAFMGNTTLKHAGALFLGPDSPSELINCTFYGNETPGNGGAIFGGRQKIFIQNCTFSENIASYGPALFNDQTEAVTIYNSLFVDNIPIDNQYAYRNCTSTYKKGSVVIQWPAEKENGNADNPCIPGTEFFDPLLSAPAFNGGPTRTMALDEESGAIGICDSCPETDQRGFPRKERCDAGAYEFQ